MRHSLTPAPTERPEATVPASAGFPPAPEPLPVPVMDNHTHLDFPTDDVRVEIAAALDAAEAVGVRGAVQVGCDLESSRFTVRAVDLDAAAAGGRGTPPQ